MFFVTEKVAITREELLKEDFTHKKVHDGSDADQKPVENILCEMVSRIINENKSS
ncbi:MAG: hypothetical protein PHV32_19300 [Eubacteriales bacterium]|nr:hypothetical protein [Eubacteriales bacterium]